MFYLTTHSKHFILRLYGVGHIVNNHSDSEGGNPLPSLKKRGVAQRQIVRSWCGRSSDRTHLVDPLSYFSFHPCYTDILTKAVVCTILSVGLVYKNTSSC